MVTLPLEGALTARAVVATDERPDDAECGIDRTGAVPAASTSGGVNAAIGESDVSDGMGAPVKVTATRLATLLSTPPNPLERQRCPRGRLVPKPIERQAAPRRAPLAPSHAATQ